MCTLEALGFKDKAKQDLVQTTATFIALAAITGVVVGVLGLYGVIQPSNALWTQVGLFGVGALLTGYVVSKSDNVKSKLPLTIAVISVLALPVLFGSLGAVGAIPPHNMLWAGTAMAGVVVFGAFAISACAIARECCGFGEGEAH